MLDNRVQTPTCVVFFVISCMPHFSFECHNETEQYFFCNKTVSVQTLDCGACLPDNISSSANSTWLDNSWYNLNKRSLLIAFIVPINLLATERSKWRDILFFKKIISVNGVFWLKQFTYGQKTFNKKRGDVMAIFIDCCVALLMMTGLTTIDQMFNSL